MLEAIIIQGSIYFCPGIGLWIWEALLPERKIKYVSEFIESFKFAGISFIFTFCLTYFAQISIFTLFKTTILSSGIESIPIWLRLACAYFLTDFSFYFIHRFMHNNAVLWKTHEFHHSAAKLWWLSGIRGSFIHILLNQFPYLWFALFALPPEVMFVVAIHLSLHNCWQHLNVKAQKWMKAIELIYVTPRYHSIHHISEQKLQCKNLSAYFTWLDRFFGTYVDPDTMNHSELLHGLGEDSPITIRMIVGF